MSDCFSPLGELEAFRKILVEQRRQVVRLALRSKSSAEGFGASLKTVQEEIEAVDRALEDEEKKSHSV
jgi:hypothetical protein